MKSITKQSFDEIINKDTLTVVDFSATWCMPCRMLKPIMEKAELKIGKFNFYNLDVDEEEEMAKRKSETTLKVKEGLTGYLRKYAKMVSSADKVAIIDI